MTHRILRVAVLCFLVLLLSKAQAQPAFHAVCAPTELEAALSNGQEQLFRSSLERLRRAGSIPAIPTSDIYQYFLVRAAALGNYNIVMYLVNLGAHPNGAQVGAPIVSAARKGRTRVAQLLVDRGANDPKHLSDALFAASASGHIDVVRILLGEHLRYGLGDIALERALQTTLKRGRTDIFGLLLSAFSGPCNNPGQGRLNILSFAVSNGFPDAVWIILNTPALRVDWASNDFRQAIVVMNRDQAARSTVEAFIDAMRFWAPTQRASMLCGAVASGNLEVVKRVVQEAEANPWVKSLTGRSAIDTCTMLLKGPKSELRDQIVEIDAYLRGAPEARVQLTEEILLLRDDLEASDLPRRAALASVPSLVLARLAASTSL